MKQLISISLAVLLIIALTACVKYTTESEYSAMTTEPVEMVEVEVLAEQIYCDVESSIQMGVFLRCNGPGNQSACYGLRGECS